MKPTPFALWLTVPILLTVAAPALAQRTTFLPSLTVGAGRTDNISNSASNPQADTAGQLTLTLPVRQQRRNGSIDFSYSLAYRTYSDSEQLDDTQHHLRFLSEHRPSQKDTVTFSTGYTRSLDQGRNLVEGDDIDDNDPFITEVVDRTTIRANVAYNREQTPLWNWAAVARWTSSINDEIPGFSNPTINTEDRVEYGGAIGAARNISPVDSLGGHYEYRRFDLDMSGDEDTHTLGMTYQRDVTHKLTTRLFAGGYKSSGSALAGDDDTGVQLGFSLVRNYRTLDLTVSLDHRPSAGGNLTGTSLDTSVGVALAGSGNRLWTWDAATRYTDREASDPAQVDREVWALVASVERSIIDRASFRLTGSYRNQSEDGTAGDRETAAISFGAVWYPRGQGGRERNG